LSVASDILRFSNFDGKGPTAVGSYQGLGPYGTYDMAGNIKEWTWNEAGSKRYTLGGAWNESKYMFAVEDARPPFDRSYPFGQAHTFAGVDYVVDWMHEQDIIPV
jgi:formylglycine-generating enzyme required for sulfatase activity